MVHHGAGLWMSLAHRRCGGTGLRLMLQVIEDTADPSDPFGPFGPFSCRRPAPRPNSTLRAAGRGRLARRGLWTAHLTGVLALWRGALLPFVATRVALVLVG